MLQAIAHREAGCYKEAAIVLQSWLANNPQDASACALLAQILFLDKQDEAAWAAQNLAMSVHPDLPIVQRNHARLLIKQQKLHEAMQAAQAAYQNDSADPENQLILAAVLGARNLKEQAFLLVESALQSRPDYAEAFASRALLKLRSGDLVGSLADAEKCLAIKPHLAQLWGMVGSLRYQLKDLSGAIEALGNALDFEPENVGYLVNLGEFERQAGNVGAAIILLEKASTIAPDNASAWVNLGTALHELKRIVEAKAAYAKALEIIPEQAEVASNLGALAKEEGDWEDALGYFNLALVSQPTRVAILINKASALNALERYDEAEQVARHAIEIEPHALAHLALFGALLGQARYEAAQAVLHHLKPNPDDQETTYRLALSYATLFRVRNCWSEAEAWIRRALEINPDAAESHCILANILNDLGRFDEAEISYRQALEINPDFTVALNNFALLLNMQGKSIMALDIIRKSLQVKETGEAKSIFVACLKRLRITQADREVRSIMVRALTEPWGLPRDMARISIDFIKLNPDIGCLIERAVNAWPRRLGAQELFGKNGIAALATDQLMCALLESVPVCDIEIERFLTMARCVLLEAAMAASTDNIDNALVFYSALARQCFINEYVFFCTASEFQRAGELREVLVAALDANAHASASLLVAVAAYFPLGHLPLATRLLERQWPDGVVALLDQQVIEPAEELRLCATIPSLTSIENEVSLLVQNQYEENPYPRWVKVARGNKPAAINVALRRKFPFAPFRALGKCEKPDVLIAGCGTGQHPIGTAQRFQSAQILAVDLSMSSLCYAKRKTREMGLNSIEYAQADLLRLGLLGRRFDVIESGGVLHHLEDPWEGWRVLLSLLRPDGVMGLGFYSAVARRNIVKVRAFIADQGCGATASDIRQCRQDLVDLDKNASFGTALKSTDFFSISACRDLLFHVQEHLMTLTGIDAFLRENNLVFLGFEIDPQVIRAYKQRFPDDHAATNLAQWQIFEKEHPDTFFGMYQFWIQKQG